MISTTIKLDQPAIGAGSLLRIVGGAHVYRLATCGAYFVDWVDFAAGEETPLHDHSGIEHHFVAHGRVETRFASDADAFETGEFFFWDGRHPHTSFAAGAEPAAMVMVRGINPSAPSFSYAKMRMCETGTFFDGIGQVEARATSPAGIRTKHRLFVALPNTATKLAIDDKPVVSDPGFPLIIGRNSEAREISIEADGSWAFLGLE